MSMPNMEMGIATQVVITLQNSTLAEPGHGFCQDSHPECNMPCATVNWEENILEHKLQFYDMVINADQCL